MRFLRLRFIGYGRKISAFTGARKVWRQLRLEGVNVARCTVERLMRRLGILGVVRGQRPFTTISDPGQQKAPDLVKLDFTAMRPHQLWVADFTYVATWSGFVYVAFVIDVYARCIVSWRVATSMKTGQVLDALELALWAQKHIRGLIHHSDRGRQLRFKGPSQHWLMMLKIVVL